jgi:hypothetical protein
MAKDKKSFILYSDAIHTVEKLSDKDAGQLLKHLLRYVNDQNPTTENPLVEIAFEPIKQQLKRDLVKFEDVKGKRSEAGKAGAIKRWQDIANANKRIQTIANIAVNDNVNVNVISKDIYKRKQEFASQLTSFVDTYGKQMIRDFYDYWTEHGEKDKKMRYEKQTSFNLDARLNRWNKNVQERNKPKFNAPTTIID